MSLVQRDYILRLFEQMAQVITIVIGLREAGQPEDGLRLLGESLLGTVGFDLDDIEHIPAADLVGMVRLARSGHVSPGAMVAGQLGVMALVLREASILYDALGETERRDAARLKALHLNLVVTTEEEPTIDEAADAIPELVEQLDEYVLPFDVTAMLVTYYEQTGDFARAEDRLFELIEEHESGGAAIERGIEFYSRLRDLSDDELTAGGLPRDEVDAGLSELRSMQP